MPGGMIMMISFMTIAMMRMLIELASRSVYVNLVKFGAEHRREGAESRGNPRLLALHKICENTGFH